jgi:hypothetical protein
MKHTVDMILMMCSIRKSYIISKDGTVIEGTDCVIVNLTRKQVNCLIDYNPDSDRYLLATLVGAINVEELMGDLQIMVRQSLRE